MLLVSETSFRKNAYNYKSNFGTTARSFRRFISPNKRLGIDWPT